MTRLFSFHQHFFLNTKQMQTKLFLQQTLMADIFAVTTKIQNQCPELYEQLKETPLFLSEKRKGIGTVDFEHYLESLKTQLKTFKKNKI